MLQYRGMPGPGMGVGRLGNQGRWKGIGDFQREKLEKNTGSTCSFSLFFFLFLSIFNTKIIKQSGYHNQISILCP
jgi:hypothetical protein